MARTTKHRWPLPLTRLPTVMLCAAALVAGCGTGSSSDVFGFRDWDFPYGIGGTDARRLSYLMLGMAGMRHLIVAVIEGATREDLDLFLPSAEGLIATVHMPLDRD